MRPTRRLLLLAALGGTSLPLLGASSAAVAATSAGSVVRCAQPVHAARTLPLPSVPSFPSPDQYVTFSAGAASGVAVVASGRTSFIDIASGSLPLGMSSSSPSPNRLAITGTPALDSSGRYMVKVEAGNGCLAPVSERLHITVLPPSIVTQPWSFKQGWAMASPGFGRFRLGITPGGDLQLLDRSSGSVIWHTGKIGASTFSLTADGNFIVVDGGGGTIFSSHTSGHPGASLQLQADGNLVVYAGSTALWSTGTGGHSSCVPVLRPRGAAATGPHC
jgi:hypothetical protein